jgi:hypothetical protein
MVCALFVPEHRMSSPTSNITDLLRQAGDPHNHEAWEALYQAVGSELHRMAEEGTRAPWSRQARSANHRAH